MNRLRKRFLTLLFLLPAVPAFCQDMGEDEGLVSGKGYTRFLGIGAGAIHRSFYDEAISSIRHYRTGGTASVANIKINETKYTELYFQGSYLKMQRKSDDIVKANVKTLNGLMDYRHLIKIAPPFLDEGKYDTRVGGIFSTQFCHKDAPHLSYSSEVMEYAVSLGLSSKIARQQYFRDRKAFVIWELSIPVIAFMSRPGYLNQTPVPNPDYDRFGGFFANNTFTSFGKFFRLNSRVHILYPIKNGNKLRFTYQWDYYRMKGASGKVYSGEHSLQLAFLFNY